jgi:putative ABC transport system substrate-binding protein
MMVSVLRASLALLVALLLMPAPAGAQRPERVFCVGSLMLGEPNQGFPDGFFRALQAHGYVEGKNLLVDRRWAGFDNARLVELASAMELTGPDLIVAFTHQAGIAASRASTKVPIVVWAMHDAVALGLVRSLARPGGNVTGVEAMAPEIDPKRVETLKRIVPHLKRLGVLYNAADPSASLHIHSLRAAGLKLGVTLELLPIRRPADVDEALAPARLESIDALFVMTDEVTAAMSRSIGEIAVRARLPTACEFRLFAVNGCLVSYGPTFAEFTILAAAQVDRILKGTRPADLPVQQVTRFELVINAQAAAALGITVPNEVRLLADDVIQ